MTWVGTEEDWNLRGRMAWGTRDAGRESAGRDEARIAWATNNTSERDGRTGHARAARRERRKCDTAQLRGMRGCKSMTCGRDNERKERTGCDERSSSEDDEARSHDGERERPRTSGSDCESITEARTSLPRCGRKETGGRAADERQAGAKKHGAGQVPGTRRNRMRTRCNVEGTEHDGQAGRRGKAASRQAETNLSMIGGSKSRLVGDRADRYP